ncbi:MAG: RQC domain-containing protein [Thermus sp.]|uniref:RQC domain-containing protein n=1 Tax=Thermus sp. TaxID=275 RepID=UPI00351BBF38
MEDFSQKDLERFYQPLDTLLLFFKYAAEHGFGGSPGGRGLLGRRSTLMALKGKARTQNSALSPRYTGNRFFGHLSFIPDKELERAFNEALERGFIAQMGEFQGKPLYGLTQKGRDYLQGMRREVGVHA